MKPMQLLSTRINTKYRYPQVTDHLVATDYLVYWYRLGTPQASKFITTNIIETKVEDLVLSRVPQVLPLQSRSDDREIMTQCR